MRYEPRDIGEPKIGNMGVSRLLAYEMYLA